MIRSTLQKWIGRLLAPNLPVLAGFSVVVIGCLMFALAFKGDWFRVPESILDDGKLSYSKSSWERPLKLGLVICVVVVIGMAIRHRADGEMRGKLCFSLGLVGFSAGLVFSHLTIVSDAELSHRASWILSQHDNLTWLGGDIYTAREYEQVGGGLDLMVKDPQQIIGSVPPPYLSFDLGTLHDVFDWMGLGANFTSFKGNGWGFLMVGSVFLMVGGLATRPRGEGDGMSSSVLSFGMRMAAAAACVYVALVSVRVWGAGKALETARERGDLADYQGAIDKIETAQRLMPCLRFDTGMILQRGLYEHQNRDEAASGKLYHALLLESGGFRSQAEVAYVELAQGDDEAVRREALRSLFRLGIIDFNSSQETEALRHTEMLISEFPTLPKARYVRLLLAVRLGETDIAFDCQKKLYTIAGGIGRSEKRSYLASGHQHLGDLAYNDGDYVEAWEQFVNRIKLEK